MKEVPIWEKLPLIPELVSINCVHNIPDEWAEEALFFVSS